MESEREYRRHRQRLGEIVPQVQALLEETASALDGASQEPTASKVRELERMRAKLEGLLQAYLEQNSLLLGEIREHVAKIEEANRKAAMSEKSRRPANNRDEARIQQLSEELTTKLRLERIDAAIKEILDFLSDAEFFTANASTGRRRRLRALQNAIEKALEK